MNELLEKAKAQLMMIEQIYELKIKNRDEIAMLIAEHVETDRQILMICSSLNTWLVLNNKQGDVIIPGEVLAQLFKMTAWQDRNA